MTNTAPDLELVADRIRRFGEDECRGYEPLYAELSPRVADDPALIEIIASTRRGQPYGNAVFAAVQYLLLAGAEHPLRNFYRSLNPQPLPPTEAFPVFRDFALAHADEIRALISTRLVQTNEVGRSCAILPALTHVSRQAGGAPLALVEVGASAGLNLLLDRFDINYGSVRHGDPLSPVHLHCEIENGVAPPVGDAEPVIDYRVGLDLNPIDLRSDDEALWLRALVWPEVRQRVDSLRAAIELARADPPHLLGGDALELLPGVLERAPADDTLCVLQSFVLYQFSAEMKERFFAILAAASRARDVYFVSYQALVAMQRATLDLTLYRGGKAIEQTHLAETHFHGSSLSWLAG